MTGRCATCRFWDAMRQRGALRVCAREGDDRLPDDSYFGAHATVADDHGLREELVTGPNFGCVHHKEKED